MITLECKHCSNSFFVCESWAARGRKFCSRKCLHDHWASEDRFWMLVNKTAPDQCWEWLGCINQGGYGLFGTRYAHRTSVEWHGIKIPKGMYICHSCDNRKCVNPAHLFVGTHQDNIADMVEKKRQAYGMRKPNARLTQQDVHEIRIAVGSQRAIAKQFGISQAHVSLIKNDINRRHD